MTLCQGFMRSSATALVLATAAIAAQPAQAVVSYVFNADEGLFAFESENFISYGTTISASAMVYCLPGYTPYVCETAMFSSVPTGDQLVLSIRNTKTGELFERKNVFQAGGFFKVGMVADKNTRANLYISGSPSVAPSVPEPATWALMVSGFGLIGGALRRRPARITYARC